MAKQGKEFAQGQLDEAAEAERQREAKEAAEKAEADRKAKETARLAAQHKAEQAQKELAKWRANQKAQGKSARRTAITEDVKNRKADTEPPPKADAKPKASPPATASAAEPSWAKGKSRDELSALRRRYSEKLNSTPLGDSAGRKKWQGAINQINAYLSRK